MKISQLDHELKQIVNEYGVFGAESIINALVRACKDEPYLSEQVLKAFIVSAYTFEMIQDDAF